MARLAFWLAMAPCIFAVLILFPLVAAVVVPAIPLGVWLGASLICWVASLSLLIHGFAKTAALPKSRE